MMNYTIPTEFNQCLTYAQRMLWLYKRVLDIEASIPALPDITSQLETINATLTELEQSVAGNTADITNLSTSVSTALASIENISADVTTLTANYATLSGLVAAINSTVDSLSTFVHEMDVNTTTNINSLMGRVSNLEAADVAIGGRLDTINGEISNIVGDISSLDTRVTAIEHELHPTT